MAFMIEDFLNYTLSTDTTKMLLPFLCVVFFFLTVMLVLKRVKKTKLSYLDYIIATAATIIAYFSTIFILQLKRFDYVFDVFRYLTKEFERALVVLKGLNLEGESLLTILNVFTLEINSFRISLFEFNRFSIKIAINDVLMFIRKLHFDLLSLVNAFKHAFSYTYLVNTKSIVALRC